MRTPIPLIVALACCVLAAVLGATLLTVRIEQQAIDQTRQAHEEYVLVTLRNAIDATMTLGLSLDQSPSLQPLIERAKSGMPDIRDISIHGPAGRVLYSTDLGMLGTTMPASWRQVTADAAAIWCADGPHERSCGTRLHDDLGRDAGGIVLVAPQAAQAYSLQAWLARGLPTLTLAVLAVLVSTLGACWLARRRLHPFWRTSRILQGQDSVGGDLDVLVQAAQQVRDRHQASQQALDQQLRQLRELDHADD